MADRDRDGGGTVDAPESESSPAATELARLVVVGGGMSAQHLLESLVARGGTEAFRTTLLCEELCPPYDRVHLGRIVGGEVESLALRDEDWYAANGIELRLKDRARSIDRASRLVQTESGAAVPYDRLVLATGGRAFVPPIAGSELPGVLAYRTVEDAERIAHQARRANHAVVAGGGLLGLEAARAIQKLGCEVEIVEMAPRLLPRQLDVEGAFVLERQIRRMDLGLRLLTRLSSIAERDGRLRVELSDGEAIETDLVLFAAGIRPRDELAREAGLPCHPSGGIVVDDILATEDPAIQAIGECVRHRGELYGLVAPCNAMAEVLADRLLGGRRRFEGAPASARLKLTEVDVAAVGESLADGPTVRDLTWIAPKQYRRIVLRDGRLVGAIAVGSGSEFPNLQEAVARRRRIRTRQERRFARTGHLWPAGAGGSVTEWPDAAIVCTCTGVTCGSLRAAWRDGCHSSAMLSEATGAGRVCGSCRPLLADLAGEVVGARRRATGKSLGLIALASLAALGFAWWTGPVPMATSVLATPQIDFLWRDAWWKQASGFTLVGLMAVALALPLRKRIPALAKGSFTRWRLVHSAVGLATILAAGIHTGMRLGVNLNLALMACFVGLVALGAVAGVVTSLEHRLPPRAGSALRIAWTRAHVALFWPLPVLLLFHVLAVYFY